VVSADLKQPMFWRVRSVTDDIEIGLLAFIAGANTRGQFVDLPAEVTDRVIAINVTAMPISRHYGHLICARGHSGIISPLDRRLSARRRWRPIGGQGLRSGLCRGALGRTEAVGVDVASTSASPRRLPWRGSACRSSMPKCDVVWRGGRA
jgi:hypothetical protein